jgi:putative transposase
MICYTTRLISENQEDLSSLMKLLEWQRFAVNEASKEHFGAETNSIVDLHRKVYRKIRAINPEIPSQVVIRSEQECLSNYRAAKSNGHVLSAPVKKKALSCRLDKRLYSKDKKNPYGIRITTADGRKSFSFQTYPKLKELLDNHQHKDPSIFVRNGQIWISFAFDLNTPADKSPKLALGVDFGIRVAAACSDGRLFIDKKFNKERRRVRYLKRMLMSKGTKSAHRHLKKLRRKERNKNKNQTHALANAILKTPADVIAIENLKGIKTKKSKFQNKNRISQVPFYDLRMKLTYKALLLGKQVVAVSPRGTSQIDSLTGKKKGRRQGRRFYAKSGLVYDADLNASRNIGQRSELPVSYGSILDGQGEVMRPIVCQPLSHGV